MKTFRSVCVFAVTLWWFISQIRHQQIYLICKLTTTLTGFIYFCLFFSSSYQAGMLLLENVKTVCFLTSERERAPRFFSASPGRVFPRGRGGQKNRQIWEPPGKDSTWGELPSWAQTCLPVGSGTRRTWDSEEAGDWGREASWIGTAKKREAKNNVSSLSGNRKDCSFNCWLQSQASCLPQFSECNASCPPSRLHHSANYTPCSCSGACLLREVCVCVSLPTQEAATRGAGYLDRLHFLKGGAPAGWTPWHCYGLFRL